ncbi:MAG TPA: NPCBM/NEW2 domain-containing protein [Opitutaceae bacterium]|jgi:alpha-galactosidase|nr:NPCBM/NEW2 domain-containing protein [Opitutaceae bacterium]
MTTQTPLHRLFIAGAILLAAAVCARSADDAKAPSVAPVPSTTSWLAACVEPKLADNELARPVLDKSVGDQPLIIAGRKFDHGVGTQLETTLALAVNGATRFTALAGVDDATTTADATVVFTVEADGQTLWHGERHRGDKPAAIDVDVHGHQQLLLSVGDVGHAQSRAYADWADAQFTVDGEVPKSIPVPFTPGEAVILTPPAPAEPRINGARVFGVRPGSPFLFTIPATGERPIQFAAAGLPDGLSLDAATGRITGVLAQPGSHTIMLHATNAHGTAAQPLRIEVGERIALTPPMGWNSWNCWATAVDQDKVLRSAKAMAAKGLVEHGWTYINIDDTWQGARPGPTHALQGNAKFPDMKALCDAIHNLGLKAGIYSTPWVTSYAVYPGGSAENPEGNWTKPPGPKTVNRKILPWAIGKYSFAAADAKQWAEWGMDYLKYDWSPNEAPETAEMANALRASGRDIVYSLSNNAPFAGAADWARLANAWRTTGDIRDSWGSMTRNGFTQDKWRPFAGPGHWNDPDMLVVGYVGWGPRLHAARLTPNEQYTHISLWCLLSSPLLIGCDLEKLDAFTLNLLTNDEVLAVDQDPLGHQAVQAVVDGRRQIWVKEMADGSRAIGLFNLSRQPDTLAAVWSQLGLTGPQRVRDLWRQKDLGVFADQFTTEVPPHGTMLIRIWPTAAQ